MEIGPDEARGGDDVHARDHLRGERVIHRRPGERARHPVAGQVHQIEIHARPSGERVCVRADPAKRKCAGPIRRGLDVAAAQARHRDLHARERRIGGIGHGPAEGSPWR